MRCRPVLILENAPDLGWMDENILALGYQESGQVNGNVIFATNENRSALHRHR